MFSVTANAGSFKPPDEYSGWPTSSGGTAPSQSKIFDVDNSEPDGKPTNSGSTTSQSEYIL